MFNKGIFNKIVMDTFEENDEQQPIDDISGTEEEVQVNDKRRIKINDAGQVEAAAAAPEKAPVKSPEVVKLETDLSYLKTRCEAAETKLSEVQKRFDDAKKGLERETAEMRERLKKSLGQQANEKQAAFLTSLLPVLDNLNRAIIASETDASFEHLLEGVKGTARSFEQALASVGVEAVESVGSEFNPEIHDAIEMIPSDAENDGRITAEFSRGYKFGDRLLRPARVQVGKGS
jgi:molecular chaperone GrpE